MRPLIGVETIAARALRDRDAWPTADLDLGAIAPARAERWRPWRADAAMRLWAHGTPTKERR